MYLQPEFSSPLSFSASTSKSHWSPPRPLFRRHQVLYILWLATGGLLRILDGILEPTSSPRLPTNRTELQIELMPFMFVQIFGRPTHQLIGVLLPLEVSLLPPPGAHVFVSPHSTKTHAWLPLHCQSQRTAFTYCRNQVTCRWTRVNNHQSHFPRYGETSCWQGNGIFS